MKKILIIAAAFISISSSTFAATNDCKRRGGGYVCGPNNIYVDGSKAASEAEAHAIAVAKQEQTQGQAQGQLQGQAQGQQQSSDNSNSSSNTNTNGGNSVVVEGAPKHTTSIGLGVSVGISVPVNQGFVGRQRMAEADWWLNQNQTCVAYAIMLKSRFAKGITVNCGDKGGGKDKP